MNRLEEIKARAELVAGKPDNREPTEKEWDALTDGAIHDVPALLAAVEAVLELHPVRPNINHDGSPSTTHGGWCHVCSDRWGASHPFPCPTVTAIQAALGEGE